LGAKRSDIPAPHHDFDESVILRELPKVIFLYPTIIASLILGVLVWQWPQSHESFATAFIVIIVLNFIVLAFDFPRTGLIAAVAFGVAIVLALMLISARWSHVLPDVVSWALGLHATANSRFYFAFGIALGGLLLLVLAVRLKADFVEVSSMEVKHSVLFGQTTTLRMDQVAAYGAERPDMLEYLLLRTGTIWIQPEQGRTLVIEHVPLVDLRERQIGHLLSHIDTRPVPHPHRNNG